MCNFKFNRLYIVVCDVKKNIKEIFLEKSTLGRSEWTIVLSLIFVLLSIVLASKLSSIKSSSFVKEVPLSVEAFCSVTVEGAVSRPGSYRVPIGTSLKKILRKSSPSVFADLRFVDLEKRMDGDFFLKIEELKEIEVSLRYEGGESVQLQVPVRTRVCDLKMYVSSSSDRSSLAMKSRRVLRPFEVVDLSLQK